MHVVQTLPQLDHRLGALDVIVDCHAADTDRHEDKAKPEHGINLSDYLVDRKKSREEVINQNYDRQYLRPVSRAVAHDSRRSTASSDSSARSLSDHESKQAGRANHEHNADHDEQHDREQAHNLKHEATEIFARDLGDARAVIAD